MAVLPTHDHNSVEEYSHSPIDHAPEGVADEKAGLPDTVQDVEDAVANLTRKLGDNHDGVAPMDDIHYVMDKIEILTVDECKLIIAKLLKDHEYDYNFSSTQRLKLA
ncbi:hypothetical protein I5L01_15640, partial [Erythrobacter sp. YJ-T3-07]|uniref:hypothetical protein n=1 Tax=Erythrobacter sp. YJ-T3-07 TaxID=2793063 RepID=UPI0018D30557